MIPGILSWFNGSRSRPGSTANPPGGNSAARCANSAPGWPDIAASRPHEPIVVELLDAMRRPASHPRHGEDGRVEPYRQSQVVIEPCTRPVHVGRQLFAGHHGLLNRRGNVFPALLLNLARQFLAIRLEDRGPGIGLLVHAVAKPHDSLLAGQRKIDPALGAFGRAHALQYAPGLFTGSSVQWALERSDRGHDSRSDVRQGR